MIITLNSSQAKNLWLKAQGLHQKDFFGQGALATPKVVEHLGYVQIDTINVIERCHHHILHSRISNYKKKDLHQAQSLDKTVFEYWTHALSYVPTKDFAYFLPAMKRTQKSPSAWFQSVKKTEMQKVLQLIKKNGAITIRDIRDDVLKEKEHEWDSRKPSKRALQLAFYGGRLTISERVGMLKKYELLDRHFSWEKPPKAASEKDIHDYLLNRALRAQGVVSLDSICHLAASLKPKIKELIENKVKKGLLLPVFIKGAEKIPHWVRPQELEEQFVSDTDDLVHILSPFDPLIIMRKRLALFFNYEHRFEAYVPPTKRIFGYFALPVLRKDQVIAAIDLKTDRQAKKLLLQKWTWVGKNNSKENKRRIEEEMHRFERFQLESA